MEGGPEPPLFTSRTELHRGMSSSNNFVEKNDENNTQKLLKELHTSNNRSAHFKTVIALVTSNTEVLFDGIIEGQIISEKRGANGFGYDPVFVPNGYQKTFAELSLDEKSKISHRAKAMQKLLSYLTESTK